MTLHRIEVDVIQVMYEVSAISNPVVRESALPDLGVAADEGTEFVRVSAFDQLNRALNSCIKSRSHQEVNMFRHYDKGMKLIAAFTAIAIKSFQKNTHVIFNDEQFATSVG
jgi:hypothetical protein